MGAQWEREMALEAEMRRLSLVSYCHELHFFVSFRSAPCPRRCALAGPRGCARWRRRAPARGPRRVVPAPRRCVASAVWRVAARGARPRAEAARGAAGKCPARCELTGGTLPPRPRQQTHTSQLTAHTRRVSHMRSDSWSCTPQNDTHTHAHSERWR